MTSKTFLAQVAFCAIVFKTVFRSEAALDERYTREKRAAVQAPVLTMDVDYVNVTDYLRHGDRYGYVTTLKHSHPASQADAKGVHVTWMLAPFIKFRGVVSFFGPILPKIVHRDDSFTLKLDELAWGAEYTVTFAVEFDPEKSMKPANYSVVTPVQLLYYDEYSENSEGELLSKGNYFSHPLEKVAFNVELPGCSEALGMKSKRISDYQITASSSYAESQPSQARESAEDAWCATKQDKNQYIQVDFLIKTRVTRVGTLRRGTKDHWVSEYSLQYSDDDITWIDYIENGHVKVFKGPQTSSDNNLIIHCLRHPIEANNIRLRPLKWDQQICLRMELYGCDIPASPANCISPLGLESGDIKDEALSASNSRPQFIRLNMEVPVFPHGWWAGRGQVPPDYLQIDFGSLRKVTRVATMGAHSIDRISSSYYVETYKLEYSNNGLTWKQYRENGQVKDVRGPKSKFEAKYAVLAKLAEPFLARYLRIIPNDGSSSLNVMRAEIYGCFAEELPPYNDVPEYARRSFLLDPVTDRFFTCMYSAEEIKYPLGGLSYSADGKLAFTAESSCFSTVDGIEWTAIKPLIISITAACPTRKELYGLDRRMNFHCSRDSGETWRQITNAYLKEVKKGASLVHATPLPETLVSEVPTANLTAVANSTGVTWGVSGSGIHVMAHGGDSWTMVGTWKCCGM